MVKGASEDRLAHLSICTGVPRDCLPEAMDDRVGWRKRVLGGVGGGCRGGGGGRCSRSGYLTSGLRGRNFRTTATTSDSGFEEAVRFLRVLRFDEQDVKVITFQYLSFYLNLCGAEIVTRCGGSRSCSEF